MWLTFFVALAVALLSGMGTGSAGLLVIFLTLVQGVPQLEAQGLNLLFFLFSAAAALCVHARRTPPFWGLLPLLIPIGLLGARWGTALALRLPQASLREVFGWFLILSGGIGLLRKR